MHLALARAGAWVYGWEPLSLFKSYVPLCCTSTDCSLNVIVLRLAGAVTGFESAKFSPLLNRTTCVHVLQALAPRCMRRMTVARQSRTHFLTLAHVHSMPNGRLTRKQDRKLRLVAGKALSRRPSALKPPSCATT